MDFPTALQETVYLEKYSRYRYDLARRETWPETVERVVKFLKELSGEKLPGEDYEEIEEAIKSLEVMPSMRLLATAGEAARRNPVAVYNCAYLPIDSIESLVEVMVISMSGTGVGYSVEQDVVEKLPVPKASNGLPALTWRVEDSAEGWAEALRWAFEHLFEGQAVTFDVSQVRPAGAPLVTKGGRASGPEVLMNLLGFIQNIVFSCNGERLTTLQVHDIVCAIGEASVQGGHRRSAMISLFSLGDEKMLTAKDPENFHFARTEEFDTGYNESAGTVRVNANNSIVWPVEGITKEGFDAQMGQMFQSGTSEPGIFNLQAVKTTFPKRREFNKTIRSNPCNEISLNANQFCNLSSIVARVDDDETNLLRKARLATIIGTIQSMSTSFRNLRPEWKRITEAERLLGVDLAAHMDSPAARDPEVQRKLKETVIETNRVYADLLGIPQSASTTTVKPSGNSSQLLGTASGIHARYAEYYIRRIRLAASSPLFHLLRDQGVPYHPENGQEAATATTFVLDFPVKSPEGAITKKDLSALDQLNYWLQVKRNYVEHNASCTIYYHPEEEQAIRKWLWEFREEINGLSFQPSFDSFYPLLPYEEVTKEQYETLAASFPIIDFSLLPLYDDMHDNTSGSQEMACGAGGCETI